MPNSTPRLLTPAPEPAALRAMLQEETRLLPQAGPWVMVNMVTALDGSITLGGHSQAISGSADQVLYRAIRELADVILVGAGTARIDSYKAPRMSDEVREIRITRGQRADPALIVVTRGQSTDITGAEARDLGEDPAPILAALAADFGPILLCEGGPQTLRTLQQQDLVNEWFISVAPMIAGGEIRGLVAEPFGATSLHLDRVAVCDDFLLLRYLR